MILSISRVKAFKACRRLYDLKYNEGLTPVHKPEALEIGSNYHKIIADLNAGADIIYDEEYVGNYTKECAMARAYMKYIYPHFHVTESEKYLEKDLGNGDKLIGYVDAIADDGHIVEHKTCGSEITEQYEYNLIWDEQILAYMFLSGQRKVWYTVCRKPTIRQKHTESDEDFYYRMMAWYDEDTESKIRLLEIERTDDEVEAFRKDLETIKATMQEAQQNRNYYRNTCHCNIYGRRCEYSSVCMHYDPKQQYIEYIKEDRADGIKEDRSE